MLRVLTCLISVNPRELFAHLRLECNSFTWSESLSPPTPDLSGSMPSSHDHLTCPRTNRVEVLRPVTKSGKDQWDCEIVKYYTFLTAVKLCISSQEPQPAVRCKMFGISSPSLVPRPCLKKSGKGSGHTCTIITQCIWWIISEMIRHCMLHWLGFLTRETIFYCWKVYVIRDQILELVKKKLTGSFVITHRSWSQADPQVTLNRIAENTSCVLNWLRNVIKWALNYIPEPIKYTKTSYLVGCHLGISLGSASVCYNKTTSKLLLDQDLIFFFFFCPTSSGFI